MTFVKTAPKRKISDFSDVIKKAKKQPKRKPKAEPYKVPRWFSKLPAGSHGSTPSQKKAWKVVSDYVRQRDFTKYAGKCVSCFRRLDRWQDGQAAHYRPWSTCNGLAKFNIKNLALSCAICNYGSGADVGYAFGNELVNRYGYEIFHEIELDNNEHKGKKIEEYELVEMVARLAPHLVKE